MAPKIDEAEFLKLIKSGLQAEEMAQHFGVSKSYVYTYKSRLRSVGKLPKSVISIPRNKPSGNQGPQGESILPSDKCPVCKKTFYGHFRGWAYKIKVKNTMKPVCTWKCQRKWERGEAKA